MAGEAAAAGKPSGPPATPDFVIRHWRPVSSAARELSIRRRQPANRLGAPDLGLPTPDGGGDVQGNPTAMERGTRYTSLRDLMDSPLPTPPANKAAGEIRIKNRLVKRAAYAYLQPASSLAESDRHRSLRRGLAVLTCGLAAEPLVTCFVFLTHFFCRPRRRLF
ncbi:hypothetical protein B296_00045901 [Ensete ventricosum]|uniref:Uncharacterized protein n=1 Tax=Ensete ventricosum TaxID=4639 RepID=A0A426Z3S4_ENSVE|nr:hypothetical protein B296_00045901 [Ensete ventricosum]